MQKVGEKQDVSWRKAGCIWHMVVRSGKAHLRREYLRRELNEVSVWNMQYLREGHLGKKERRNSKHKGHKWKCSWHVRNSKKTSVFEAEWTKEKVIRNGIRETGSRQIIHGLLDHGKTVELTYVWWKWLKDWNQRSDIKPVSKASLSCHQKARLSRSGKIRIESGQQVRRIVHFKMSPENYFPVSSPCLFPCLQQHLVLLWSQERQKVSPPMRGNALHTLGSEICLVFREDVLFKWLKAE